MLGTLCPYVESVRAKLNEAICIQTFACQSVERHNKPEVEFQTSPELLLEPLCISRNQNERVLIEASINSPRISMKFKQSDALEGVLCDMHMRFLMPRAETFEIMRRVAIAHYDISFLITDVHCLAMKRKCLVDFVCGFLEEMDAEINRLKLAAKTRGRAVGTSFLRGLAN